MINPATGQDEDVYGREAPGALVAQQDEAAATAPTFIDAGSPTGGPGGAPSPAPNLPPALGPDEILPVTPDAAALPPGEPAAPALGSVDLGVGDQSPVSADDNSLRPIPPVDVGPAPGAPDLSGIDQPLQLTMGGPPKAAGTMVPPLTPPEGAAPATAAAPVGPDQPKTLADERIETAKKEAEVKAELARIEAKRAQADLEQKVAAKDQEDKIIAKAEQRVAEGRARREAEYTKYKDMSVQDAWGDNGTTKRVLAGIAMILGGRLGAAVVIGAAQGLEEKKKTELALQEKAMANAGKSLDEIKDETAEEMANFKTRQAASFGVTAARLEQEKRAQGIPEAQIAGDQEIQKIKAEEQKAKVAANKLAIDTEKERLQMELAKSQTKLNEARTAKLGAHKGGGGGGSTGALQQISDYIKKNPDDQPGQYALADKLGFHGQKGANLVDKLQNDFKKGPGSASPATALRRERVAANIHEFNVNAGKLNDNVITPDVLQKVQNNETRIASASKTGGLVEVGGRFLGLVPKSKFDGLTDAQVTAMRAMEATLQHGSEMQPTTGAEVSHQWKDTYRPKPGMSQEEINASIRSIKEMGPSFRKIIDPTDIGARANSQENTPPAPAAGPPRSQADAARKAAAERVMNDSTAPSGNRARAKQEFDRLSALGV